MVCQRTWMLLGIGGSASDGIVVHALPDCKAVNGKSCTMHACMCCATPHAVSILSGFPRAAAYGLRFGPIISSSPVKVVNYEGIDCCPCCVCLLYSVCHSAYGRCGQCPLGSSTILAHLNLCLTATSTDPRLLSEPADFYVHMFGVMTRTRCSRPRISSHVLVLWELACIMQYHR